RDEVRNPEAAREGPPTVEALEGCELADAEAGGEVGPEAHEGRRGGLHILERAVWVEPLAPEDVREELRLVELAGDDLPLREEVPEAGVPRIQERAYRLHGGHLLVERPHDP